MEVAAPVVAEPVKAAPARQSAETTKLNRAVGRQQYVIAGKPTKADVVLLLGREGIAQTWQQRIARGVSPENFQALLAAAKNKK